MVFHGGNDDLISCHNVGSSVGRSYEVNSLCGAFCKDDFFLFLCIDKPLGSFPGLLKCSSSLLGKRMDTSMNIGVDAFIIAIQCINYALRFLRGGRIVEVDQRLSIYFLMKHRKLRTDIVYYYLVLYSFFIYLTYGHVLLVLQPVCYEIVQIIF